MRLLKNIMYLLYIMYMHNTKIREKKRKKMCNICKHVCVCVQKNSTSLDGGIMNPVKERDKNCKRKSYLNRSRHMEVASIDHLSEGKKFINGLRKKFIDIKCNCRKNHSRIIALLL